MAVIDDAVPEGIGDSPRRSSGFTDITVRLPGIPVFLVNGGLATIEAQLTPDNVGTHEDVAVGRSLVVGVVVAPAFSPAGRTTTGLDVAPRVCVRVCVCVQLSGKPLLHSR